MRILLTSTLLAAALAVSVPAHAHGGPPWRHGHHKHKDYAYKHDRYEYKHHRHYHGHHRPPRKEVHNHYYGYGVPAYPVPPGVHVVFPDIFLPWP